MFDVSCGYSSIICWWRFTESGQLHGSFPCLWIPHLGKSRAGLGGHLALSICCGLTHHPASLPQFPHCSPPGPREVHATNSLPARLWDPQNTREKFKLCVFCLTQFPFQPEVQRKEQPSSRLGPSPHPPRQVLHQQLLSILLHGEQAPAQTQAEGSNCCMPSPSKRTLLSLTVSSQILGAH